MSAGETETKDDRYIVPALQRGLDILAMFSRSNRIVTVPQACKALGISRATAFRLFYTLEANGFIARIPNSTGFRLHSRSLSLGFDYLHSFDVADVARPHLDALRDATGATTHLGVRVGTEMFYVLRAASPDQRDGRLAVPVGTRHPAHAVSCGRALLLDLPEAELDRLYEGYDFDHLPGFVPADLAALKARLAVERVQGYVVAESLTMARIKHIAAPVHDAEGRPIAAINVADKLFPDEALTGWVKDRLLEAAAAISRNLGHQA
ncbi:IclR family transcriptional regulator [Prosthecomicrobium pneumaticum]|uniref:DNA-binding IclR family transcriptional regulator n=1 Tax=Prosthecomicrobium pneumaticum TaxID=81895 RepID=A0A7W9FQU0_9HYPH|nr:IclR family transcriptional regulator [Prosthecomicrobium pneumaticum]MBB5755194.1 DNA-binding IclR family transcriptional regulator [Prosthecomicrobium pneumaticum]